MAANLASTPPGDKRVLALTSPEAGFYIAPMKWRNQVLALLCLLAFLALGVLYFKKWVVQKPFGIILFIGEGLDPARLAITRIYAADASTPLTLDSLPYSALLKNYSQDSITPDSAAAATALATGVRVKNGTLGLDADGKALQNLLELARQNGRMTGLVTDNRLTSPTAAAFYAHLPSGSDRRRLAQELSEKAEIDLVLGGGADDFYGDGSEGALPAKVHFEKKLKNAGYDFIETVDELEAVPRWRRAHLFGLFSSAELAYGDDDVARGTEPSLADMVRRAIELLQYNRGGYLLVVNAGLMRKAALANDADHALLETMELDRAVSAAREYADPTSMIFVAGDVALGGLALSGGASLEVSGGIWWGADAAEGPWLTWATGPNGPQRPDQAAPAPPLQQPEEEPDTTGPAPELLLEPAAVYTKRARESVADVIALGQGPGAEALHGVLENTQLFQIIRDNL